MAQNNFEDENDPLLRIIKFSVYIFSLYIFGKIFSKVYARIIGEILVGLILGPQVLDFIPYNEAFSLIGEIGLLLIILTGGLSISLSQLKQIGIRAFIIAILGTIIPVVLGWLLVIIMGYDSLEGLACGTALSSTSMGVTVTVLQQQNYLTTETGKLIAVAAMIDDIASLVILAIITQISDAQNDDEDNQSDFQKVWMILGPLVISGLYIMLGVFLARWFIPKTNKFIDIYFQKSLIKQQNKIENTKNSIEDKNQDKINLQINHDKIQKNFKIGYLVVTGALLSIAVGYSGSTYLLGAFVAGMSFSEIKGLENTFEYKKQTKEWLSRIFFSTLGFVIPIKETLTWKSFGGGLLYTLPAVLGKLFTGLFAHKGDGWIVGWAMVGRGELGFVMAKTALENDIMGEYTFSISVWALLIATFISPFIFKYCIIKKEQRLQKLNLNNKSQIKSENNNDSQNQNNEIQQKQDIIKLDDQLNTDNKLLQEQKKITQSNEQLLQNNQQQILNRKDSNFSHNIEIQEQQHLDSQIIVRKYQYKQQQKQ